MSVDVEVRGRTAVVTINRPEARNAVNGEVAQGIEAAMDRIEADDEIWTGVLTGAGSVFCAGADLKLFADGRDGEMFTEKGNWGGLVKYPRTKPLIAAVDGAALAGGFELVLACDLVVASKAARFGLPEVKRSLMPIAGGIVRLPHLISPQLATYVMLTAEPISAERAYEIGLVSELVEAGGALEAAVALADRINTNAPLAVRETLRLIKESRDQTFDETWKAGRAARRELAKTDDYKEGPQAFVEKRSPVWKGR